MLGYKSKPPFVKQVFFHHPNMAWLAGQSLYEIMIHIYQAAVPLLRDVYDSTVLEKFAYAFNSVDDTYLRRAPFDCNPLNAT